MSLDSFAKISAQMRKGILEYLILSIILQGEAYASDILETLKKNKILVVEGTMYPLLSRLKKEGVISYYWIESKAGPPRKYYKLTTHGQEMLKIMSSIWGDIDGAVKAITS